MPKFSIIIDYVGLFREVICETYNFYEIYLISCLVQLLRNTFHKILLFTLKFISFLNIIYIVV